MADRLAAKFITAPTVGALRSVDREVRQANITGLKAAGKAVEGEARRRAPVYQGPRRDVPKGRLRRSIKAGRVRKEGATGASVTVAPRGQRVWLYAGKIEQQNPYMEPAYRAMQSSLTTLATQAYMNAINRGAR